MFNFKRLALFIISLFAIGESQSQIGYSLLKYNSETYLIVDYSAYDGVSMYYNELRAVYAIEDDQLVIESVISDVNQSMEGFGFSEGSQVNYNGSLTISKIIDNESQITKILEEGALEIDGFDSELSMLSFDSGKIKKQYCIGSNDEYCADSFGQLSLYYIGYEMNSLKIFHEDKEVYYLSNDHFWGERLVLLPVGTYKVVIETIEGKKRTGIVEIKENERYIYNLGYGDLVSEELDLEDYGTMLPVYAHIGYEFLYSNSRLLSITDNEAPTSYYFGVFGGYDMFNNKLRTNCLAISYGFSYGYNRLNREIDSIGNYEVKRENYNTVYYTTGLYFRQFFNLPTENRWSRPMVDIGVQYRLPIYFRKNIAWSEGIITEKWLHKFNELVVYTRIGISNGAALNVSYRPFNSIKNNLPELPKLQFGISFLFDN